MEGRRVEISVMVATKVKDAELWLPRFITQVEALEGDIEKIVVMYAKSRDKSFAYLDHWRQISQHTVEIYRDPYLPPAERHGATLARVKQDIQKLLENIGSQYYLNLDCDLVHIPKDSIPRLMAHDKDIIAGMVWTEGRDIPTFFDVYEFRTEGCRFHPFNPPGMNKTEPFEVDSMSTFYLAKSEAELAGEYKNPYPHIPFCANLKDQGYQIWVDPTTHALHMDLERVNIMHQPLPIPLSAVPYIDATGFKWAPEQVGAQIFFNSTLSYQKWLFDINDESNSEAIMFLHKRPLITASYKVHGDDWDWFLYSVSSIYDYVDCIDVVSGPVKLRAHEESTAITGLRDPDGKIREYHGIWATKEEIQAKLLEVCRSKWMFFIDADEVYNKRAMEAIRLFCSENQMGEYVYARPKRFINFWHDFKHIAYSLNPLSSWGQYSVPHPMLLWRDVPALNFGAFHTIPQDGFGRTFTFNDKAYPGKNKVLDDVEVFHFGNAKDRDAMQAKVEFESNRGINYPHAKGEDPWFTGKMPVDMVIEKVGDLDWPEIMRSHPRFGENQHIQITKRKPYFRFRRIKREVKK